jgi:hypothetical protein
LPTLPDSKAERKLKSSSDEQLKYLYGKVKNLSFYDYTKRKLLKEKRNLNGIKEVV